MFPVRTMTNGVKSEVHRLLCWLAGYVFCPFAQPQSGRMSIVPAPGSGTFLWFAPAKLVLVHRPFG